MAGGQCGVLLWTGRRDKHRQRQISGSHGIEARRDEPAQGGLERKDALLDCRGVRGGSAHLYYLEQAAHGIGAHGSSVMRAVVEKVGQSDVAGGDDGAW